MRYNATIEVEGDANLIYETFGPESKNTNRAQYSVEKTNTGVKFIIKAKDSVAMRAILNSISKTLDVVEKSKQIN